MISRITDDQRSRLPECARGRRETIILERARGRRVLHVGACDSPYWKERLRTGTWLHAKLADVASECVGVDVDAQAVADLERNHGVTNLHACESGRVASLGLGEFDLIVAADVIEHVSNPGAFLADLRSLLDDGGELLLTTVNTYSLRRFLRVVFGTEVNHPDHVAYHSYVTLRRLLEREGFEIRELHGYPCEKPAPWKARFLDRASLLVSPYLSDGLALVAAVRQDASK